MGEASSPTLSLAQLLAGRFEIQQSAGQGGMGTVYRAIDTTTGQPVALKLLHLGSQAQDRERFEREAQLLAQLQHPAIVRYVAHGVSSDGAPFLAMEWLEGEDLGERLRRGPLGLGPSLMLLRQVAGALATAHKQGVVHRDLKPGNLFLRERSVELVALLDFGIARQGAAAKAMTKTGMVIGTPEYMAPEQARGERELGPAADIFSLGCVFFECLTGQPPFAGEHIPAILAKILFEDPPPLSELQVPSAVQALLLRMLAKNPAVRLRDAGELLVELDVLAAVPNGVVAETLAAKRDALLGSEQQLVSLVMATFARAPGETPTLGTAEIEQRHARLQSVQEILERYGARVELLADGSLVATLMSSRYSATDQAALAARGALFLKERLPDAALALATGRGRADGRLPVGEALDRVGRILYKTTAEHGGAESSAILIDEVTAGLISSGFHIRRMESGVHALIGEEERLDETRPLLGRPTPCVGRENELGVLELLLSGCIEESHARIALVTALAGLGKSRLRHEFLRRVLARDDGTTVLQGRADIMSKGSPFAILSQAVRRLCELHAGQTAEEQQRRLSSRIGRHVSAAHRARVVEFFGELCGVTFSDENSAQLRAARNDPKIMNDQVTRAFADFVRAECGHAPVILILEDLHWGDTLSVQLVEAVVQKTSDQPLLVLALARPEVHDEFPRLWKSYGAHAITLKALSRKACARIIHQVLGQDVDAPTVEGITTLSAGNPLFLEELIRAQAEGQVYQEAATVLAILQARVAQLDPVARQVLRAASLFGQTFWRDGLLRLMDIGAEILDRCLADLVALEHIEQHDASQFRNDVEYSFRHALMRDAVYALLTDSDRQIGHLEVANYLIEIGVGSERNETMIVVLAGHLERGGDQIGAVVYYSLAAEQSYEHHDLVGMLNRAQQGILCGAQGPELGMLHAVRCVAHAWRLEWAVASEAGEAALRLLPSGTLWWYRTIQYLFMLTPPDSPSERMRELVEIFATVQRIQQRDETLCAYAAAAAQLIEVLCILGDPYHAIAFGSFLEYLGTSHLDADLLVRGWTSYAQGFIAHSLEPEPLLAVQAAQTSVQSFQEAQAQHSLVQAQILLGLVQAHAGMLDEGTQTLRNASTLLKESGALFLTRRCQAHLAALLSLHSDRAALEESCTLARAALTDVVDPGLLGVTQCALARALLKLGDPAQAIELARAAYDLVSAQRFYKLVAATVYIDALLADAKGDPQAACAIAEQGLTLLAAVGCAGYADVPLRVAAAAAFRAAGETERARAELSEALRQIDIRSQHIPDPVARQRYLDEVAANLRARALELAIHT